MSSATLNALSRGILAAVISSSLSFATTINVSTALRRSAIDVTACRMPQGIEWGRVIPVPQDTAQHNKVDGDVYLTLLHV